MSTIILDTCVLQYRLNACSSSEMDEILQRFSKKYQATKLHISEYSQFELLRGVRKILQISRYIKDYSKLTVSSRVLTLAGFLYSAYQEVNKQRLSSDGDYIIAASAFLTQNSYILTADGGGFPRPFFKEIDSGEITYTKGKKFCRHDIFLLKPNWKALADGIKAHKKNKSSS